MSCDVGCRPSSDPALLWLWLWPAGFSSDWTLSLGTSTCCGGSPKKKKKEKEVDLLREKDTHSLDSMGGQEDTHSFYREFSPSQKV